jgi:hypothetical protein
VIATNELKATAGGSLLLKQHRRICKAGTARTEWLTHALRDLFVMSEEDVLEIEPCPHFPDKLLLEGLPRGLLFVRMSADSECGVALAVQDLPDGVRSSR